MKAFITGVTGQDGYYLSKFLLEKGYQVHGIIRRSSTFNTSRIDSLIAKYGATSLNLYYSDLLDPSSLRSLIEKINPDEIYNLAAQSHVAVSFKNPLYTSSVAVNGTVTLLEAVKNSNKNIKFYQASSSEMYGGVDNEKLNEKSTFIPKSPYAISKVFSHDLTKMYREAYSLFCVNGILFNHESPMRGETFVTRKITRALGRINQEIQSKLTLGNLEASRDWGFAGDYVEGMWLMMQHDKPDDWVLATGESYTVKDFLEEAFKIFDLDWNEYVDSDQKYFRPNEVNYLLGDSTKARELLNWKPKTSFKELVEMMVLEDDILAQREKILIKNGLLSPTWENPL
tara:strand:+ start:28448 stop:29473 length:1026 start_codon:yes stop_codon:yes gene_type:complete